MIVKENKQYVAKSEHSVKFNSYNFLEKKYDNPIDQFKQLISDTVVNGVPLKNVTSFEDVKEGLGFDFDMLSQIREKHWRQERSLLNKNNNIVPSMLRLDMEEKSVGRSNYLKFDVYSIDDYRIIEEFISAAIDEIDYLNQKYESECKTIITGDVHYKKFLFEHRT